MCDARAEREGGVKTPFERAEQEGVVYSMGEALMIPLLLRRENLPKEEEGNKQRKSRDLSSSDSFPILLLLLLSKLIKGSNGN